jgi:hypothetical protein
MSDLTNAAPAPRSPFLNDAPKRLPRVLVYTDAGELILDVRGICTFSAGLRSASAWVAWPNSFGKGFVWERGQGITWL